MGKMIVLTLIALLGVGLLYCYSSDDAARDARLADQRRQDRLAETRNQEDDQCNIRNQEIRSQQRRLHPEQ